MEPKRRSRCRKRSGALKGELLPLNPVPKSLPPSVLSLRPRARSLRMPEAELSLRRQSSPEAPGKELKTPILPRSPAGNEASRAWKWVFP